MSRLRAVRRWLHEHTMLVDTVIAVPLGLLFLVTSPDWGERSSWGIGWLLLWVGGCFVLPLVWRRTRPDVAMAVVAVGCVVQLLALDSPGPQDVVALVMLYAVAAYGRRRLRWWWLLATLAGSAVGAIDWTQHLSPLNGPRLGNAIAYWVFCAAVAVASFAPGVLARQRKDLVRSLRERADSLERERDSSARLAAQEERSRIAREMHDVVAHSLSVIVVQSDGAAYAVEHGDPDQAQALAARTLTTIGDTARTALAETRRLVGVLRDSEVPAEYAPQATLDQLGDLVRHVNDAGMPATLAVDGDPGAHALLDQAQQMAAYRVVQEALTNALKHAGPGARVEVAVRHEAERVALAVRDTGRGQGATDGLGHGLIGMRERMTALGGDFVARERVGGGFEVLATLPLAPSGPPDEGTGPAGPTTATRGDDLAGATTAAVASAHEQEEQG